MKRILLSSFLIAFMAFGTNAQTHKVQLDSIYKELDIAIENSEHYVQMREMTLSNLKKTLRRTSDKSRQFDLNKALYEEYRAYINDSAIYYLRKSIVLAEQLKRTDSRDSCKALLAFQCSTTGMYTESFNILQSIKSANLSNQVKAEYLLSYNHLYNELAFYTKIPELKSIYYQKADSFQTLLFRMNLPEEDAFLQKKSLMFYGKGDLKNALRINDQQLSSTQTGSRPFAIITFYRSLFLGRAGNHEMQRYWLAESALSDVKNAIMDQGSLWELAKILGADENQTGRSYRYIRFAWFAAQKFDTRVRSWQIVPVLSNIDKNYQAALDKTNHLQKSLIIVVSVLSICLLFLLFYVIHQRNKLVFANQQIKNHINLLRLSNQEIKKVNKRLNESNKMKEEYVGRFMRLCSIYIDKTESLKRKVAKGLKTKDFEELDKLSKLGSKDITEFYEMFDNSFLNLFPNFINDFNALLRPEVQMEPIDRNKMNTTVRIFALIRLGIDDSSKIAEFLHYSVNTIYNYRAQTKNGALGDRDLFEKSVKEIGMSS